MQIIQTGIRGNQPDPQRFNLTDFQIEQAQNGHPTWVTCPNGQSALATRGKTSGWFARSSAETCAACPFQLNQRCRARPQQRDPRYFIHFTLQEFRIAQRRKDYLAQKQTQFASRYRSRYAFAQTALPHRKITRARQVWYDLPNHLIRHVRERAQDFEVSNHACQKRRPKPQRILFCLFSSGHNLFRNTFQLPAG